MEGVNSTMTYCKNFCKCYNVPPVQQLKKKTTETKVKIYPIQQVS
jgi:hypothetical protein